jgi:DNA-binding NtrC family response regulator
MPKKTGADLIAAVEKEFGQQIKFILMSGHGSPRIESNGIDIGSYPFLRKPVNIYNLLDIVATVLENKEA